MRESLKNLAEAILLLKTEDECIRFLIDICTEAEIKSIAQRLEVAKLLEKNYTYVDINSMTGASTATISRIKRALTQGEGGYKVILQKLAK